MITAELVVSTPGRAEIIGNHTDYNRGLALAAGIQNRLTAVFGKGEKGLVRVFSKNFPSRKWWQFRLDSIKKDSKIPRWVNYVKGVVQKLLEDGYQIGGADIYIDSSVPISGGVSSSAALELAILTGFKALYRLPIKPMAGALLCQKAENEFVGSQCGLLDQATIVNSHKDKMVLLDFNRDPVGVKLIDAHLAAYAFLVVADLKMPRVLAKTGYNQRRAKCEQSLPVLSQLLAKTVASLRDVSWPEFKRVEGKLRKAAGEEMVKRVRHVVSENQRVEAAALALEAGEVSRFKDLLNRSGRSALDDYELDEGCPALRFLCETMWELGKTLDVAARNMGGGFNPMALALVHKTDKDEFKKSLSQRYEHKFKNQLEFIEFTPGEGVLTISLL